MPYYHVGFMLTLLAWDAARGERLPVRTLTAVAVAYLLADRLVATSTPAIVSVCYAVATLIAAGGLVWVLGGKRGSDLVGSSGSPGRRSGARIPSSNGLWSAPRQVGRTSVRTQIDAANIDR
jgi:hypothetical protein